MNDRRKIIVQNKNRLTYPSSTLDPVIRIVDQAREIENAHELIQTKVNHKLDVILKQIRILQDEARSIIDQAKADMELHQIPCRFIKKPGETLYLYRKIQGDLFFSRISPDEWGESFQGTCLGIYKVTADLSFEKIDGVS
jgi:hypothetical protein